MLKSYNQGCLVIHRINKDESYKKLTESDILSNTSLDRKLLSLPFNDTGNARRVLLFCRDVIKYDASKKQWYCWSGKYWKASHAELEIRSLIQAVMDRFAKAIENSTLEKKELAVAKRFALKSNDNMSIANVMTLLKNMNYVKEIESSPHLLNVQNGVVDLRKRKLYPHSPFFGCTSICSAKYNPDAKSSRFKAYMHEITDNNDEIYDYLQTLCGYCAFATAQEQKFFVLLGNGSNGKSKFLEAIHQVLDDYSSKLPINALKSGKDSYAGSATPELVPLIGKRLSYASELNKNDVINDAVIKQLTGGKYINVRMLRKEYIKALVTFKILLDTNYVPQFSHYDFAIERRMVVIPFTRKFEGKFRDNDISRKLEADSEYILKWIINGAYKYYNEGLNEPISIVEATREIYSSQDSVGSFAKNCLKRESGQQIQSSVLYENYKEYCDNNGFDIVDRKTFSQDLRAKGFERKEKRQGTFFLNIVFTE